MNIEKMWKIIKLLLHKEGIYYSPRRGRKPGRYTFVTKCGGDYAKKVLACEGCEYYQKCKYLNRLCNILNSPE